MPVPSCLKSGAQPGTAHTPGTPRAVHRLIRLWGRGIVCGTIRCHPAPLSGGAGDLSSTGDPSAPRAAAGASTAAPSHGSGLQMLNPPKFLSYSCFVFLINAPTAPQQAGDISGCHQTGRRGWGGGEGLGDEGEGLRERGCGMRRGSAG